MHITTFGAAGEVTGSCYLVSTSGARVLVDCGLFQGSLDDDRRNQLPRDLHPAELDAVVLTHGEERARNALAHQIALRFGLAAELPLVNDVIAVDGAANSADKRSTAA